MRIQPAYSIVVCLVLCLSASVSKASQDDIGWDRFRMPEQYQGVAEFQYEVDNKMEHWKQVKFSIGKSFTYLEVSRVLPGIGQSIIEIRYSNIEESLLINPATNQVQRTTRFAQTYSEAGEVDLSPLPILRALFYQSDQVEIKMVEQSDDGTTTYRLSGVNAGTGFSEIEVQGDKILTYRSGPTKDGKFVSTISYKEWTELASGHHVPTLIQSDIWDEPSGYTTRQTIQISDLVEQEKGVLPTRPTILASYTVIDHIEGVAKQDGKVISEIQYGETLESGTQPGGASSKQASNWLVWLGVGFVVLAGIILGIRTKAARG